MKKFAVIGLSGAVIIAAMMVGCARSPDKIDRLVADLASTDGGWLNGYQAIVQLPESASKKQVLTECFKSVEFRTTRQGVETNGYVKEFEILKVRQVHIPSHGGPDLYTAVLAHTDFVDAIVLLRPGNGWWWRAFDADKYYGRIKLPPLQKAVSDGNFEIVKSLLNQNADVNAKTVNGMTALHLAAMGGPTNILKLLLAHEANVKATTTNEGWTPLHMAAYFGNKEGVQLLLESNADINARARYGGSTPLHYAAEFGYKTVAELLLAKKADVNAKDYDGKTPLDLSVHNSWPADSERSVGCKDVAELLRQHGGKE